MQKEKGYAVCKIQAVVISRWWNLGWFLFFSTLFSILYIFYNDHKLLCNQRGKSHYNLLCLFSLHWIFFCQNLIFFLNNPTETHIVSKENCFCNFFLWCFVSSCLIFMLQLLMKEEAQAIKLCPPASGALEMLPSCSHPMPPNHHETWTSLLLCVTAKSQFLNQRDDSESWCAQTAGSSFTPT